MLYQFILGLLDVIRSRRASHMIVGEGIRRVEESPFHEVEKPTMGSLQLMRMLKS